MRNWIGCLLLPAVGCAASSGEPEAGGGASDADAKAFVAAQVELALEALAPFPLAQMYYGHFWKTGAANALVFAAYRKRFTAEQTEAWHDAEAVMPARPEVVLTWCTNYAGAAIAAEAERRHGVTVLDATVLPLWHALRMLGMRTSPAAADWGRLFDLP